MNLLYWLDILRVRRLHKLTLLPFPVSHDEESDDAYNSYGSHDANDNSGYYAAG